MNKIALLFSVGCVLLASLPSRAQSLQVNVDLFADVKAIKPGEAFTIGVMLHVPDGAHVYWRNPGDAGLATHVSFSTSDDPATVEIVPLEFPVPTRFDMGGHVMANGYEGDVMFMARVSLHDGANLPKAVHLTADAKWLCCKENCFPGKGSANLTIPVADKTESDNKEIFDEWKARVPTKPAHHTSQATPSAGAIAFAETIHWPKAVKSVQWFTACDPALDVKIEDAKDTADTSNAKVNVSIRQGMHPASPLVHVVVGYTDDEGNVRGVTWEEDAAALTK